MASSSYPSTSSVFPGTIGLKTFWSSIVFFILLNFPRDDFVVNQLLSVAQSISYRKVASSRLSWLVVHFHIFRLFMKGNFDAYVLWPLDKMVQNWIVDRSTAGDFTVVDNSSRWCLLFQTDFNFLQIFHTIDYRSLGENKCGIIGVK